MKKQVIATALAAALMTGGSITAHAANRENALDGYPITIHDSTTPAAYALGKDWPITRWYFFDEQGNTLGSIPNSAVMEIARTDDTDYVNWELWLADAFNEYRGVDETTISTPTAEDWALEVIKLTNAEREKHGLHPLEVDEELMELAQIRAEEVSTKYSHERPDGTRVSQTHGCGENVGARRSAEKQVAGWMNSEGHRTNILLERYQGIGVGCYQKPNGNLYWVQIFRP